MAEFCLDCWNSINETNHSKNRYILTDDLELCEGCGEYKQVIIAERFRGRLQRIIEEIFLRKDGEEAP